MSNSGQHNLTGALEPSSGPGENMIKSRYAPNQKGYVWVTNPKPIQHEPTMLGQHMGIVCNNKPYEKQK